jgi:hypothetical protein
MQQTKSPIGHEFLNLLSDDEIVLAARRGIPIFVGKRNGKGGLSFKCPACRKHHHHEAGSGLKKANCFAKPPAHSYGYFVLEPLTDEGIVAVETIKRSKVEAFLRDLKGAMFGIDYIKQNEEPRSLTGRLDVAPLKGGKNKVEALSRSYLTVFDVEARDYRTVNLDTATRIRVNGKVYDVVG